MSSTPRLGPVPQRISVDADLVSRLVAEQFPGWAALPVLAPRLPLAIPTPLAKGGPGAGYPFSWSVYSWLEGEPASSDSIAGPVRFAVDLAGFLSALQGIDTTDGPRPGLHNWYRGGPLRTYDGEARRALTALDGHIDTGLAAEIWTTALDSALGEPELAPGVT